MSAQESTRKESKSRCKFMLICAASARLHEDWEHYFFVEAAQAFFLGEKNDERRV